MTKKEKEKKSLYRSTKQKKSDNRIQTPILQNSEAAEH